MRLFEKGLSLLLAYSAGHAMYVIDKSQWPLFIACSFGLIYGIIDYFKDTSKSLVHEIAFTLMEVATLPLINIELYKNSRLHIFAELHLIFIIPLLLNIIAKIRDNNSAEQYNTNTLNDIIVLGNVISTMYLGYSENIDMIVFLGTIAMGNTYGSLILDGMYDGAGEQAVALGYAVFFYAVSKCTSFY